MRYVLAVGFLLLAGCPPASPLVAPAPDAQDGAPPLALGPVGAAACAPACANLARLGCPEGQNATCEATCQHMQTIADMAPGCLADAGSVDAALACGSLGPHGCGR